MRMESFCFQPNAMEIDFTWQRQRIIDINIVEKFWAKRIKLEMFHEYILIDINSPYLIKSKQNECLRVATNLNKEVNIMQLILQC